MGRKRLKRGSSSSTSDESKHDVEGDDCPNEVMKDAIDGLAELHADLDKLRYDFNLKLT